MMSDSSYEDELGRMLGRIYARVGLRRWTYRELAQQAGVAVSTAHRLDHRSTRLPRLRTVMALARAVGLELTLSLRERHRRTA
jgi:transcriptional regulator with XRE-family HTH domain